MRCAELALTEIMEPRSAQAPTCRVSHVPANRSTKPSVRLTAIERLGERGNKNVLASLRFLLRTGTPDVKAVVAVGFGRVGMDDKSVVKVSPHTPPSTSSHRIARRSLRASPIPTGWFAKPPFWL